MSESTEDQGAEPLFNGQLATGMIVFGSVAPVAKIVTDVTPAFLGSETRRAATTLGERVALQVGALQVVGRRDAHGADEHESLPRSCGKLHHEGIRTMQQSDEDFRTDRPNPNNRDTSRHFGSGEGADAGPPVELPTSARVAHAQIDGVGCGGAVA